MGVSERASHAVMLDRERTENKTTDPAGALSQKPELKSDAVHVRTLIVTTMTIVVARPVASSKPIEVYLPVP